MDEELEQKIEKEIAEATDFCTKATLWLMLMEERLEDYESDAAVIAFHRAFLKVNFAYDPEAQQVVVNHEGPVFTCPDGTPLREATTLWSSPVPVTFGLPGPPDHDQDTQNRPRGDEALRGPRG